MAAAVRWCFGVRDGTGDGLSQIGQRLSKNLCVYGFLGFEVKVERCRRVTGGRRDRPQ
jgi:hypothetical protein